MLTAESVDPTQRAASLLEVTALPGQEEARAPPARRWPVILALRFHQRTQLGVQAVLRSKTRTCRALAAATRTQRAPQSEAGLVMRPPPQSLQAERLPA